MTLVERFIEIRRWPTSRKNVLLLGVILPNHLLAIPIFYWVQSKVSFYHGPSILMLFQAWAAFVAAGLLVSLWLVRRKFEARWSGYVFAPLYNVFATALIYLLGSSSTSFAGILGVVIMFQTVYWDERIGFVSMVFSAGLFVLAGILEATGHLPYAPALLERSIDAQRNGVWFATMFLVVGSYYVVAYALIAFLLRADRLREDQLNQAQKLIRRYVPAQVADSILSGQQAVVEKHERRKLTIFFSDLVGFTEIAEEMEPEDLSRVLNEYFSEMTRIAGKHGGTVDELAGDAVLVFFGAPHATDDKDHALRAVRMAAEMQQAVAGLNEKWKAAGIDVALKVRMGLNTGVVTIGNFGSPERMKYSALGKHVNIAARLQAYSEPGQVLLSHATWLLVQDQLACQPKGELSLKGIAKPVMAYGLVLGAATA